MSLITGVGKRQLSCMPPHTEQNKRYIHLPVKLPWSTIIISLMQLNVWSTVTSLTMWNICGALIAWALLLHVRAQSQNRQVQSHIHWCIHTWSDSDALHLFWCYIITVHDTRCWYNVAFKNQTARRLLHSRHVKVDVERIDAPSQNRMMHRWLLFVPFSVPDRHSHVVGI